MSRLTPVELTGIGAASGGKLMVVQVTMRIAAFLQIIDRTDSQLLGAACCRCHRSDDHAAKRCRQERIAGGQDDTLEPSRVVQRADGMRSARAQWRCIMRSYVQPALRERM